MATYVEQFNPVSCVLACIESILADIGQRKSQTDLFNLFRLECSSEREDRGDGTVALRHIPSILLGLNLGRHVRFGPAAEVLPELLPLLAERGFILLATRIPHIHCVRVIDAVPDESLEVMDPSPETGHPCHWKWSDLSEKDAYAVAVWDS